MTTIEVNTDNLSPQHTLIFNILKKGGTLTVKGASVFHGIDSLCTRLTEMRRLGFHFKKQWGYDKAQNKRCMRYWLDYRINTMSEN